MSCCSRPFFVSLAARIVESSDTGAPRTIGRSHALRVQRAARHDARLDIPNEIWKQCGRWAAWKEYGRPKVSTNDVFRIKTRNLVLKTMNCVLNTRIFVFKMMNFTPGNSDANKRPWFCILQ